MHYFSLFRVLMMCKSMYRIPKAPSICSPTLPLKWGQSGAVHMKHWSPVEVQFGRRHAQEWFGCTLSHLQAFQHVLFRTITRGCKMLNSNISTSGFFFHQCKACHATSFPAKFAGSPTWIHQLVQRSCSIRCNIKLEPSCLL